MMNNAKNLSDTRGNSLGIGFFRMLLGFFGPRAAGLFVWFVAFFYALFDREALHSATPYLKSVFPNCGFLGLRWHFYRLIVSQGQAIVMAYWSRSGHSSPIKEYNRDKLDELLRECNSGLILLISHAGCWQAALQFLGGYGRRVNLLIQMNSNMEIARLFNHELMTVIDNGGPFGGLLECTAAIERGEIVCIMGDRAVDEAERAIPMAVHGRNMDVPASPWVLAAKCKCPIVPVFSMMNGNAAGIDFFFSEPIHVGFDLPRKPNNDDLSPFIRLYAKQLEKMMINYPYQIFHFSPLINNNKGDRKHG